MFKLPSIELLIDKVIKTAKRFPLTILCAIIGTSILIHFTRVDWLDGNKHYFILDKILLCSELGLCLFFAAALFSESKKHSLVQKIIFQSCVLVFLVAYYFTLSGIETFDSVSITRYSLYIIAAHLLVSFAPFIGKNKINGFWQFNKNLFSSLCTSFLYTIVLYAGISAAFAAIDALGIHTISYHIYLYLWYFLMGVFNTCFFLSKIPENVDNLETDISYPKGLKSFTQFVLLPLVTLYLLILYFYSLKIICLWSLPKGYVSYLIISFSIMGIFSLLLIYPIRNNSENKWIKFFSKGFYFALYPLIVLLVISIFHRISEYGYTADRYFILVLAAWLVGIATYFLFLKKENIKIIPISLFMIAVLSSFGPWSAFSISNHSQKNKLEKLLILNHILVNGKIHKTTYVDSQDENRIESIVRYLSEKDALDMIYPWFNINMDSLLTGKLTNYRYEYQWAKTDTVLKYMGLENKSYNPYSRNNYYRNTTPTYTSINFQAEHQNHYSFNVSNFDYCSYFSIYYLVGNSSSYYLKNSLFIVQSDSFYIKQTANPLKFEIELHKKTIASFDLSAFLKNLQTTYKLSNSSNGYANVPNNKFIFDVHSDSLLFRFNFIDFSITNENGKISVVNINGHILIKKLNTNEREKSKN